MHNRCVMRTTLSDHLPHPYSGRLDNRIGAYNVGTTMANGDQYFAVLELIHAMSLAEQYEAQISQYSADLLQRECGLVEIGRESAQRFDDGHDPAGSRVQRVLAELRKLAERWERLTVLPAAPIEPALSELDQLRAKRERRTSGG